MDDKRPFIAVYIMANQPLGTLYVGVTNSLLRRVHEHREGLFPGFTRTYGLKRLVWYEPHELMIGAISREKTLKRYPREWKLNLIGRDNPNWDDLYPDLTREEPVVWKWDHVRD
ncbi:GIY-YIG nuclease family protein [Caulobacter sp. 17J80-11]|uniref:GIY-YIG nuclease family protein n=1 Tax=Caulobacter sp. 17J80-11 TaxID=2763502 RepID=UPI001653777A|nr:GIY-YIG nuclease family protein [Caulobacter sp. 17J80-11]MBC6981427.1 GIY-YIG nuclease family protein [Caulobacter sp. 17J80-11]